VRTDVRPHPGPLPQGEGEAFAGFLYLGERAGVRANVSPTPLLLLRALVILLVSCAAGFGATATPQSTNTASLRSEEDGWLDASAFLDKKYGFLPIVLPITEPAVGYGAAVGLAFISSPLGEAKAGYNRPNITLVGGFGTANGTHGAMIGDVRHWLDDHLQTIAGLLYGSVNLDFYGVGREARLSAHPLHYNLQPVGGLVQGKYRLGDSRIWGGLGYAFARTEVSFDETTRVRLLPPFRHESNAGGLTPSLSYDSRDNIFTPNRGTYLEANAGVFSEGLGADDEFQRMSLLGIHYIPLGWRLFLGMRAQVSASFGNEPFYLRPFVSLRGAPVMRYQGEEVGQIEAELRWQFWKRFSLVGFTGAGAAWNNLERFQDSKKLVTGGAGFRYELARKYGIHIGLDVAKGPDDTALYVQIGSAWARP
jgi:hypothetical protein